MKIELLLTKPTVAKADRFHCTYNHADVSQITRYTA